MINVPKGTKDALPSESGKWRFIENKIRGVARAFGLKEIRTPTFEHTELFLRGVGETTDIVNKEMYTFPDKSGRSITLKPEGTAGAVRAYIENSLGEGALPVKMYYITSVFRYERPQAGRLREHHQFGVELFGSDSPYADAEAILIAKALFDSIGIKDLTLNINSIGCRNCRGAYNAALREFYTDKIERMCPTCKERLEKNPLRILDCKEENCVKINEGAPSVLEHLCPDCKARHEKLQEILKSLGIDFKVNPRIVRGLDYYTGTVFEFVSNAIGAQGTVSGGGRYDDLVEEIGGRKTPAVGFGMGIERLIAVSENLGIKLGGEEAPDVYIAPLSDAERPAAFKLASGLRKEGIAAETDLMNRSFKAQMKYADKTGAKFLIVLGGDEISSGRVKIKNMRDGTESASKIEDVIIWMKQE
jgi:histidyl-tRNA synthetase